MPKRFRGPAGYGLPTLNKRSKAPRQRVEFTADPVVTHLLSTLQTAYFVTGRKAPSTALVIERGLHVLAERVLAAMNASDAAEAQKAEFGAIMRLARPDA